MKKFACGLLVGFLLAFSVSLYASTVPSIKSAQFAPDIKLIVNGKAIDTPVVSVVTVENPGYMTNYVPARAVAEELGATVTWDGKTRTISIDKVKETTEETAEKTSSTQSTVAPEPNPNVPFPVEKIDDAGINVYNVRNLFLGVLTSEINPLLEEKNMYFRYNSENDTLQIVLKDVGIQVRDIPIRALGGIGYIPYDYYLEHIKPLVK